jgi:hypothetical protein
MEQIYVSLDNTTAEALKQEANKRGVPLSQVTREMVQLGWSQYNQPDTGQQSDLNLWRQSLNWQLETRLLMRYLLDQSQIEEDPKALMEYAKTKAQSYVDGLLGVDHE